MTAPAFSADDTATPAAPPPKAAPQAQQLSDADYWDQLVAQHVEPHEATARVLARKGMPADSIWDQLTAQGAIPDSATAIVSRVTGAKPAENLEQEKSEFIAQHPVLDKLMGLGQGLARGVSFGATKNFEGPDEQGVADRNKGLVAAGQFAGTLASPITRAIGAAAGAIMPTASPIASGAAQAGTAGALQGALQPAPTLADRLQNAGVQGGIGAAAGGALSGAAGAIAGRARAPIVDQAIKDETGAAYQGMRAGAPVTDPGFLKNANALAQTPEGQAAYAAGQKLVFSRTGRQLPDLPEPSPTDLKTLFAAKLAGKPTPTPTAITSLTPEQIDAWKQGADATGISGAFRPLLTQADQLVPGYSSARGLYEAGTQPSPGLAELKAPAAKVAGAAALLKTGHPVMGGGVLLSLLQNAQKGEPLSPAAQAALRGVQQQVGDLPLGQLFQQGGVAPAALTGIAHMAPFIPGATGAVPDSLPGVSP